MIRILKNIHPLVILYILVFIIFIPVLFFKKLFSGFDLLLVFYPYSFHFLHSQSFWASGILSGFNIGATPSAFAGNWVYYFFANGIGFRFFDFITFYNFIIFFYFILTALFSYLAARMLGFDKWVSTLIASVYIFSAYNLSWMVNIVTAASLFIFPAFVYFLFKFKENRNWLWPSLGGLVLGFGLIMAHPQFALIAVFGGSLFSLFLVFEDGFKSPKWIFLAAFLAICFIGFALSAFQLIPEYQTSQLSQRGLTLSFSESQECALIPLDFVRYFIPNFNFLVSCESLLYVGVLPLILAILAIAYYRIEKKRVFFWMFLLAFSILFSIKYSLLAWIFHQLPIWRSVRAPGHFLMLSDFALAVLAGFGFNWILENKENFKNLKIFQWIKRVFLGFLFLIIAINILGLFKKVFIKWAQDFFDKYYYFKTIGLPIEHYHQSIENLVSNNFYAFSFLNKDFLIPLILTVTAFLIIIFIKKFNKTSLFYVFLLSGFMWAITSPMVSSGLKRDFFAETETVKFFSPKANPPLARFAKAPARRAEKSQKDGSFRIYSLMPNISTYQLLVLKNSGVNDADQNEFFKTMLPPNLNLIYGIDSIDGYDVSMSRRTSRILAEVLSERATLGNKVAEARLRPDEKIKIFEERQNILSMMNVKYIISAYQLDEKIFKKVFKTETTRFHIPVYIYENPNVMPRFYFAKLVKSIKSDEEGALQTMLASGLNFNDLTFIECGNDCGQNSGGKIIDYDYKDGYLWLDADSRTGGWFVFSESFDRNWQAKINGSAFPIYRANYIYQAVKVPAGENIIEFKYQP